MKNPFIEIIDTAAAAAHSTHADAVSEILSDVASGATSENVEVVFYTDVADAATSEKC